jgi:hypothetical protein
MSRDQRLLGRCRPRPRTMRLIGARERCPRRSWCSAILVGWRRFCWVPLPSFLRPCESCSSWRQSGSAFSVTDQQSRCETGPVERHGTCRRLCGGLFIPSRSSSESSCSRWQHQMTTPRTVEIQPQAGVGTQPSVTRTATGTVTSGRNGCGMAEWSQTTLRDSPKGCRAGLGLTLSAGESLMHLFHSHRAHPAAPRRSGGA